MIRAVNITNKIPEYTSFMEFLSEVAKLPKTAEVQPRYKIGWERADIDDFLVDSGRENSMLMSLGSIESVGTWSESTEEVSYYSYIYKPTNALILIYVL
jgi:hypothetical protein